MMAVFKLRYDRWGCALVFDREAGSVGRPRRWWFADEVSDTIRTTMEFITADDTLEAQLPKCPCGGQFARAGTVAACLECGSTAMPPLGTYERG